MHRWTRRCLFECQLKLLTLFKVLLDDSCRAGNIKCLITDLLIHSPSLLSNVSRHRFVILCDKRRGKPQSVIIFELPCACFS